MKILLIEDDPSCAKNIEMMFRAEKFFCHHAASGVEGLFMAERGDYDIVVLDLMLPDMDGYQVLRRLKSSRGEVPVLILSGLVDPDDQDKAFASGADDYVTKPFNRTELLGRVRVALERSTDRLSRVKRLVPSPAPLQAFAGLQRAQS